MYPIFSGVNFDFIKNKPFISACTNPHKYERRANLVKAALRHGNPNIQKQKETYKAPETLDSFKPFNMMELQYDVYDDQKDLYHSIQSHYEQIDILEQKNAQRPQATADIPVPVVPVKSGGK